MQEVVNQRINDNIVFDIGKNNKIVGIEILGAMEVINMNNLLTIDYSVTRKIVMV